MHLGAFSVSLAVKDLEASRAFYEKLGFEEIGGDGRHYLMLRNGTTVIGLFQGLFEQNILTFNPGWDHEQKELDDFTDARTLSKSLRDVGIETVQDNTQESEKGPSSFVVVDPDGNPVLVDQHRT